MEQARCSNKTYPLIKSNVPPLLTRGILLALTVPPLLTRGLLFEQNVPPWLTRELLFGIAGSGYWGTGT